MFMYLIGQLKGQIGVLAGLLAGTLLYLHHGVLSGVILALQD